MPRARKGYLISRKKGWVARVTVDREGEAVQEVIDLGTQDRAVAKRKLARWLSGAEKGTAAPEQAQREETVQEYAEGWLKARAALGIVMVSDERSYLTHHVFPEIGDRPLSSVRGPDIRAVLAAAVAKGLAKNTVSHLRALLNRMFKAAWVDELIPENPVARAPMPRIREVPRERCILTDAEFGQYMASHAGDLEVKLMALVARIEGGARTSDLIRWDWSHIDRVQFASCIIPRSKTCSPQGLAMPPVVSEALRMRWEAAGRPESGPVFPVQRGVRAGEMRATRGISFAKRLRRDLFRAGVVRMPAVGGAPHPADPLYTDTATTRRVDFHSFRRAFSSALADAGVNVQTAMRLAHHSDEKVHMRYVGHTEAMRQIPDAVIPRLPERLFDSARAVQNDSCRSADSSVISAPPRRLERPTNGLGKRGLAGYGEFSAPTVDRVQPGQPETNAPCSLAVQIAADTVLSVVLRAAADRLAAQLEMTPCEAS